MGKQVDLNRIRIASPCHARWEDMAGDDRARFCGQCQKSVYNFSAMTRTEAEALIREKEGRVCGRFYQRRDGSMLTKDCSSGVRRKRKRIASVISSISALMIFFITGCVRREKPMMGEVAQPSPTHTSTPMIMGKMAYPITNTVETNIKMGEISSVQTNTPSNPQP